jgi:hypothetical protein
MLFQPEPRGDSEGDAVKTAADCDATHPGENVEAHLQTDLHPENAEDGGKNDNTEVGGSRVWHLWT